jgi:hypothetical protein
MIGTGLRTVGDTEDIVATVAADGLAGRILSPPAKDRACPSVFA